MLDVRRPTSLYFIAAPAFGCGTVSPGPHDSICTFTPALSPGTGMQAIRGAARLYTVTNTSGPTAVNHRRLLKSHVTNPKISNAIGITRMKIRHRKIDVMVGMVRYVEETVFAATEI